MLKDTTVKTTTYTAGAFCIDIVEKPDEFEAFLYHKGYGIKDLMFGSPKQQHDGEQTFEMFLELVEANLTDYINIYREEYMGE